MSTTRAAPPPLPRADAAAQAAVRVTYRLRRAWRLRRVARGLVSAAALLLGSAVLLLAVDIVAPLAASARLVLRWLPLAAAVAALVSTAAHLLRPPSRARLAEMAEALDPSLGNRLVTALEAPASPNPMLVHAFTAEATPYLDRVDAARLPWRVRRWLLAAAGALLLLVGFAAVAPPQAAAAWERWARPRDAYPGRWREARAPILPSVPAAPAGFDELRWTVRPPSYSRLPVVRARGDEAPPALAGSEVELRSRFVAGWRFVRAATAAGRRIPIRRAGREWVARWTMRRDDAGIVLEALAARGAVADRRVLPLRVLPDAAPSVELAEPARDLVLYDSTGTIPVRARAADDYGLAALRLTWARSRGSGESFEVSEGELPARIQRGSARAWTTEGALRLDALGLRPGDVLYLRAVARDGNTVTGPGESVSATRAIRIARPDEIEQVNVVLGLPSELPKDPLLSQRMLILLTEDLLRRARRLPRDSVRAEAAAIGMQQGRLRARVGEQAFGPGGASPVRLPGNTAADPTRGDTALVAIYNRMWDAERALNVADLAGSLPPQNAALRLIQQRQRAERLIVRGTTRVDPIDVAAARGQGKIDEAAPAPRRPGTTLPSTAALRAEVDAALAAPLSTARLSALAARALREPAVPPSAASNLARAAAEARRGRAGQARAALRAALEALGSAAGAAAPALPAATDPVGAEYLRRIGRP